MLEWAPLHTLRSPHVAREQRSRLALVLFKTTEMEIFTTTSDHASSVSSIFLIHEFGDWSHQSYSALFEYEYESHCIKQAESRVALPSASQVVQVVLFRSMTTDFL